MVIIFQLVYWTWGSLNVVRVLTDFGLHPLLCIGFYHLFSVFVLDWSWFKLVIWLEWFWGTSMTETKILKKNRGCKPLVKVLHPQKWQWRKSHQPSVTTSSWVNKWLDPGLITGELVQPISSTRTADTLRLLMVPTAPGVSEASEVYPTVHFDSCTKLRTGGVKKSLSHWQEINLQTQAWGLITHFIILACIALNVNLQWTKEIVTSCCFEKEGDNRR